MLNDVIYEVAKKVYMVTVHLSDGQNNNCV